MFKDSNNVMYASLNDLIETKILTAAEGDKNIEAGLKRLSDAYNAAAMTGNKAAMEKATKDIATFRTSLEQELKQKREGKQQPQTKDPMNLGR
jgi:hypothetical protein